MSRLLPPREPAWIYADFARTLTPVSRQLPAIDRRWWPPGDWHAGWSVFVPMQTPSPTSLLALSLLSAGLFACDSDPPPPSEVRSRLSDDLGHILREAAAAGEGTAEALPGAASFSLMEKALGQGASSSSSFRVARDLAQRFGRSPVLRHGLLPADPPEGGIDTDAIIAQLNETIFTDANHLGGGIYQVPANVVCETTDFDENGNEITTVDPECVTQYTKVNLRIRVSEDDDALGFAIQLGANNDEPLSFALTHTSIAISVDLDGADAAVEALASAFGEEAPNARLAGRITGKLEILGTAAARMSLDVDRAIAVAVGDAGVDLDGADAFRFTTGAGKAMMVQLDAVAETALAVLDIKATTLHIPGADGFDLDLPGASIAALGENGQPLQLTNISLGDRTTTMTKNGAVAIAIDLNAADGRKLSATIAGDEAAGTETITVSPKLDAQIAIDHAALGDEAPLYDVTRVLLTGGLRGSDASDQVEVVGGSFAITTNPATYGFSATAGQCVSSTEELDATSGAFYTAWTVGVCQ